MNDKKNDKKKDSSIGGIIVAAFIILGVISDASEEAAGVVIVLAIIAAIGYVVVRAAKKTREAKPYGTEKPFTVSPDAVKQTVRELYTEVKKEFDVPESKPTAKPRPAKKPESKSPSKVFTEAQKMAETQNCDDDHEHVEYKSSMTDDEKRLYQLKEMLKNGLIEREEYNLMLKRYGYK